MGAVEQEPKVVGIRRDHPLVGAPCTDDHVRIDHAGGADRLRPGARPAAARHGQRLRSTIASRPPARPPAHCFLAVTPVTDIDVTAVLPAPSTASQPMT